MTLTILPEILIPQLYVGIKKLINELRIYGNEIIKWQCHVFKHKLLNNSNQILSIERI
jgi:hypothetical protein